MSRISFRQESRRPQEGKPGMVALVEPTTGAELGRFYACDDGFRVLMPDADGTCTVLLPDVYPTVHAAKQEILDAHQPEES